MSALLAFGLDLFVLWAFCAGISFVAHELAGLPAPWERKR